MCQLCNPLSFYPWLQHHEKEREEGMDSRQSIGFWQHLFQRVRGTREHPAVGVGAVLIPLLPEGLFKNKLLIQQITPDVENDIELHPSL